MSEELRDNFCVNRSAELRFFYFDELPGTARSGRSDCRTVAILSFSVRLYAYNRKNRSPWEQRDEYRSRQGLRHEVL